MTLERASELVQSMHKVNSNKAVDLLAHFVDFFGLDTQDSQMTFIVMCGFPEEVASCT